MNKLTVVMYHYVRRINQSRYTRIKGLELDDFVEQLNFFKKFYNAVTMEEVIAAKECDHILPKNPILLTFDDGYAEHFTHVYPILKSFGMQGSFYVPAKTVLEHEVLDVNKIHFVLSSTKNIDVLVNFIKEEVQLNKKEYSLLNFDDYFIKYAIASRFDNKETIFVKRMLQHALPEKLRNIISNKLFIKHIGMEEQVFSRELYMDKYQLMQLVRDGMHVGCHGYEHYWWNKIDHSALKKEIDLSKKFLTSLGCDMNNWTACYPYGSSSPEVELELERQGCKLALTTNVDLVDIRLDSRYLISRLDTNDFPPKSLNYQAVT